MHTPTSIKKLTEKVQEWRRYRESVRELGRLTDRELHDVGLTRGEIDRVARKMSRQA